MNHKGTQVIHTKQLTLRPFVPADAEAAFTNWCSDPEVTRFLTWQPHSGVDETTRVLTEWANSYNDPTFYQWAIVLRELNQAIGGISVVNQNEDVSALEIGYCLGRPWWHQGIMTETLGAVIDYLFSEVGGRRICADHDTNNPRSGMVMQACGLTYEGTLRQAARNNEGICDICVYSILRDEWAARRAETK